MQRACSLGLEDGRDTVLEGFGFVSVSGVVNILAYITPADMHAENNRSGQHRLCLPIRDKDKLVELVFL